MFITSMVKAMLISVIITLLDVTYNVISFNCCVKQQCYNSRFDPQKGVKN